MEQDYNNDFMKIVQDLELPNLSPAFESAADDYYVSQANERALELQKLLDENAVNREEAEEMIEELDRLAHHVIGKPCEMLGGVDIVLEDYEGNITRENVSRASVAFAGYSIVMGADNHPPYVCYVGNIVRAADNTGWLAGLHDVDMTIEAANLYTAYVPLDTPINFPIASGRRALAWLNELYPETVEEIDWLLFNNTDKLIDGNVRSGDFDVREEQALLGLGGFTLSRPDDISDAGWENYKASVLQYVSYLTIVDTQMPYYVSMAGPMYDHIADTPVYAECDIALLQAKALVFVDMTRFSAQRNDSNKDLEYIFALRGMVYSDDLYEHPSDILVPISAFTSLQPVRSTLEAQLPLDMQDN